MNKNKALIWTGKSVGFTYPSEAVKEMPLRHMPVIRHNGQPTHLEVDKLIPGCGTVAVNWLPFAAEAYNISPNLKDYVFAYVPALTSDIPNRNMQGFALRTLLEFDTECGCQRYKTFVGKPFHTEHRNKNPKAANGVILDSSIISVPKYKVAKVMILIACDRSKAPKIANQILANGGSYSMGCMTTSLQCSICGGLTGPGCTRTCTCYHTDYNDIYSFGKVYNGALHYLLATDPVFFEDSFVNDPADTTSLGDII